MYAGPSSEFYSELRTVCRHFINFQQKQTVRISMPHVYVCTYESLYMCVYVYIYTCVRTTIHSVFVCTYLCDVLVGVMCKVK